MRAMVLRQPGQPLHLEQRPEPAPRPGEVRVQVEACAVCRTDLHVVDGELAIPRLPLVPGHEIVGLVKVQTSTYHLEEANEALANLRAGRTQGAAVLVP